MGVIHKKLVQARFLQSRKGEAIKEEESSKDYCQYHAEVRGHGIQECNEFRQVVQNLMDRKEIDFLDSENPSINVITGTTYLGTSSSTDPKPITIFHDNEAARIALPKVPILVLWQRFQDLTSVGGLTKNGRCYAPSLVEQVIPENRPVPINEEQPSKKKERLSREKKGKDKLNLESTSKPITAGGIQIFEAH